MAIKADASAGPILAPLVSSVVKNVTAGEVTYPPDAMRTHAPVLDIDDITLIGVAKIVTQWTLVEWLVAGSLFNLYGYGRKTGRMIDSNPRMKDVIHKISTLMASRHLTFPQLGRLKTLLTDGDNVRNLVSHSVWFRDNGKLFLQDTKGQWPRPKDNRDDPVSKRAYPAALHLDEEWFCTKLQLIHEAIDLANELFGFTADCATNASSNTDAQQTSSDQTPPDQTHSEESEPPR